MVDAPDDFPARREGGDEPFLTTPGFEAALAAIVPAATQRYYFTRDGIAFRLAREIELQRVTAGQGYLITEDGIAGVPECIVWFTVAESADGPPVYTLDSIAVREPPPEDEDDS